MRITWESDGDISYAKHNSNHDVTGAVWYDDVGHRWYWIVEAVHGDEMQHVCDGYAETRAAAQLAAITEIKEVLA